VYTDFYSTLTVHHRPPANIWPIGTGRSTPSCGGEYAVNIEPVASVGGFLYCLCEEFMTGGRRAGAGSTKVGLAGEEPTSELFLQVLARSFSEMCTLYTANNKPPLAQA
jgi:hypothetical protein